MESLTKPLRSEHQTLRPHIERLREVADGAGTASRLALMQGVDESLQFLLRHLIPHAEAEDRALYPVVEQALGATSATATMSRDHVEVGKLTDELGTLRSRLAESTMPEPALIREFQRVLYGLYAIIALHFAKEEEIYLPLLDKHLTQMQAQAMFTAMEAASHTTHD